MRYISWGLNVLTYEAAVGVSFNDSKIDFILLVSFSDRIWKSIKSATFSQRLVKL